MPTYLNYERLRQPDVDCGLRIFLTTVSDKDTQLRAKTAFPEFFTETPERVHVDTLALRAKSEQHRHAGDPEEIIQNTLLWFGLKVLRYEGRDDGKEMDIALPSDFTLKHGNGFNGLTAKEPWIMDAPDATGCMSKILVLDVLEVHEQSDPVKFFLIGTYANRINFDPENNEFYQDP